MNVYADTEFLPSYLGLDLCRCKSNPAADERL